MRLSIIIPFQVISETFSAKAFSLYPHGCLNNLSSGIKFLLHLCRSGTLAERCQGFNHQHACNRGFFFKKKNYSLFIYYFCFALDIPNILLKHFKIQRDPFEKAEDVIDLCRWVENWQPWRVWMQDLKR